MKNQLIKYFPIIFLILVLTDIWQVCDGGLYRYYTKPLLMLSLGLYYYAAANKPKYTILIALVLAWIGDVFLLFEGNTFFILGLGSFLIMHLIYAVIFYRGSNHLTFAKALFATVLILPCLLVFYGLLAQVGDLLIPVIIYSLSIVAMLKTAIFRKTIESNYVLILTGAICFFFSDLVLAHDIFDDSLSTVLKGQLSVIVMILYTGGQYLIVRGFVTNQKV